MWSGLLGFGPQTVPSGCAAHNLRASQRAAALAVLLNQDEVGVLQNCPLNSIPTPSDIEGEDLPWLSTLDFSFSPFAPAMRKLRHR